MFLGEETSSYALDYSPPPSPKFYYPLVLKGIISWFVSYNI